MKKYILVLFALILMCPIFANAQTGVTVKSIEKITEETSTSVEELTPPKAEGLTINVDVKFKNVNDKIKYKVVVENKDKEDYQLNTGKEFNASTYIKYTYDFDNGSNILKANTTKTMYVTLTYAKEVPENEFKADGTYEEKNDMAIGVLREEDNPTTGREEMVVIGVVLALIVVVGFVMVKNRQTKYLVITLGALLVLVPTVNALKEITITMNTKIVIEKESEFCVYKKTPNNSLNGVTVRGQTELDTEVAYYKYTPGMKFSDYAAKNDDLPQINQFIKGGWEPIDACYNALDEKQNNGEEITDEEWAACDALADAAVTQYESNEDLMNALIKPKTEGCYDFHEMVAATSY